VSAAFGRPASVYAIGLAVPIDSDLVWFWIAAHADYDAMIE